MTDQKENIDLEVGIEEGQKAEIESHISTGAKVGTENKMENPRRKVSLYENSVHCEAVFIPLSLHLLFSRNRQSYISG
jgi:hypothetical protein